MRFPLIILVLYGHSAGAYTGIDTIYGFFSEMVSQHFCQISVTLFFFFSGYLMFYRLKEEDYSVSWILNKWKKRVHTLLIPYLLWNLIAVSAIASKSFCFSRLGLPTEEGELWMMRQGPLYWLLYGPIDFPLYFIRDMIVLTLIVPALYIPLRVFPILSICILAVLMMVWPFPILSPKSVYYIVGAWFSANNVSFLTVCRKVRLPAIIISVALLIIATILTESDIHQWIVNTFYPFGMMAFISICNLSFQNKSLREKMIRLSMPVFFIYAAHEIYLLQWTKGAFVRIFGEGVWGTWIKYLLVPLVTLALCMILYQIMRRFMPKTLAVLCGGRT